MKQAMIVLWCFAGHVRGYQRLGRECKDAGVDLINADAVARGDRDGGLQREIAPEHRESAQYGLLHRREQPVAPIERAEQVLLSGLGGAVALREQQEMFIQHGRQPAQTKHVDAHRGELDRQWQSIEAAADLGDDRGIAIDEMEPVEARRGTFDEQLDCGEPQRFFGAQRF